MKTRTFLSILLIVTGLVLLVAPARGQEEGWQRLSPLYSAAPLEAVFFTDAQTGTAVGYHETILRTTDGGVTWVDQQSGTTTSLHAVFFTDALTGTVVGGDGTILRTTDGGVTWVQQQSGTTENLWGVFFSDAMTGTIVGNGGTILHTTSGGWVTAIEEEPRTDRQTPTDIVLHQNYPNPFNPTTTIIYALPQPSDVTLTVYDLLGRQVRVLASGLQLAGTYEVSFDATGLPSGLYVYRFKAGNYVETKRMVVLK